MQPSDLPLNNTSARLFEPSMDIHSGSSNELSFSVDFVSYYDGYPVYKGNFKGEIRVGDTGGLLTTSFKGDNYELKVPLKGVSGKLSTKRKDGEWEQTPGIEISIGGPGFVGIDTEGKVSLGAGIPLVDKAPKPVKHVLPQAEIASWVNPIKKTVGAEANLRVLSVSAKTEVEVGWGLGILVFLEKNIIKWISSGSPPTQDELL